MHFLNAKLVGVVLSHFVSPVVTHGEVQLNSVCTVLYASNVAHSTLKEYLSHRTSCSISVVKAIPVNVRSWI